jgi:YVTN family beta-propeller protein
MERPKRGLATLLATVLLTSGFTVAASAKDVLYVQNTTSGDVSIVDTIALNVVGTIPIGLYPDDVVSSPDGRWIYVNRIDSAGIPGAPAVGDTGEVVAISTATNHVVWRVRTEGMPHHMTVSPDGHYVFVPYFNSTWLAVIDTRTHAVVKKLPTSYGSHVTQLSPDGAKIFVGSMFGDDVTIYDVETQKPVGHIPFASGVRPFAITTDQKTMYVQRSRLHGFDVVDVASQKVLRTVDLPALPPGTKLPQFLPHTVDHGIALSHDGKLLLANGSIANYVVAYSVPDLTLKAVIPVGKDPNWIAFSRDDKTAFISDRGSDELSVISIPDLKEIKRLKTGGYPQRIHLVSVPDAP